ncbi:MULTISPECIES: outer membrane protein [unclassified Bradyrhizobium]
MKNLLLVTGSIVALAVATPAFSADLAAQPVYTKAPPVPQPVATAIYDWSGFYIGANGGWGSSRSTWDLAGLTSEGSHDVSGGTIGGQIGYRSQMGQTVFGIEGQGNWADLTGSNVSIAFPADINRTKTNAFGLMTGLIGFTSNNVLLYAKGGAAVTSNTYQVTSTLTGAQLATDSTRWGAAIGAGVEVGFAPNWSVGIEYDHLFMPDGTVSFTTGAGTVTTDRIRQDFDLVTARLNYKFSPVVLKY